ncbi:MAG: leucine-rich repeat domain-containing protein [Oscillospiraceae bacterium]
MMKCIKCKKLLPDDKFVCPDCGTVMIPRYIAERDEYSCRADNSFFRKNLSASDENVIGFEDGTSFISDLGLGRYFPKELLLPDTVTRICDHAFYNCCTKSIALPKYLREIDSFAFADSMLESIKIPEYVVRIGEGAFENCQSLKSIELPDSLTGIGRYAFEGCCALKSITIPESVVRIEEEAFENCFALRSVTVPRSVKHVDALLFSCCCEMETIRLPYDCRILQINRTPSSYEDEEVNTFLNCTAEIIRY